MFQPCFQRMAPLPRAEGRGGADFSLLCALKNQPPTHVIARTWSCRVSSYTQCGAFRTRGAVPLYRCAQAHTHTRKRQAYDKIGGDCNFSQRRQSLREPLIIGPPGIYRTCERARAREGVGEEGIGRRAEFCLFFGGLMFVKMDILLSLLPSTRPHHTPFFRLGAESVPRARFRL